MTARTLDPAALWAWRELAWFLFWRDVKQRYKQAALGIFWALARPLGMALAFTFTFSELAGLSSHGVPYAVFALAGLVSWQLLSQSITAVSDSITANRVLVERVYCPRLILPLAATLTGIFDFAIALALFFVVALAHGSAFGAAVLAVPALAVLAVLVSLSIGLWFAAIGVWFRDLKFVVGYALQILLFLTPVGYSSAEVPARWATWLSLNPMFGVVELFRWSLLGIDPPSWGAVQLSLGVSAALLCGGLVFFARLERTFADVV